MLFWGAVGLYGLKCKLDGNIQNCNSQHHSDMNVTSLYHDYILCSESMLLKMFLIRSGFLTPTANFQNVFHINVFYISTSASIPLRPPVSDVTKISQMSPFDPPAL